MTYGTYDYLEKKEKVRAGDAFRITKRAYFRLVVQPHVALRLKRLFPRVDQTAQRAIDVLATDEFARELEWFMDRYPLKPLGSAERRLKNGARRHDATLALITSMQEATFVPAPVDLAIPARAYQLVPASMVLATGGLLVGDDVGLGKTVMSIVLAVNPKTRPMLVVTKTDLPRQFQREFGRFAPDLRTWVIATGSSHKRDLPLDLAKEIKGGAAMPDVVICSYSKLVGWAQFLAPRIRSVVYDEVQELRGGEATQRGAAAAYLSDSASYRMGLSATPIYNHGDEIHAVLRFLSRDALGTREEFMREWCSSSMVKAPKALGAYLRERGVFIRRTRSDVGRELPRLTIVEQTVDHDPAALEAIAGRASELAAFIMRGGRARGEAMTAGGELDWKLRQATGIAKAPYVAAFVRLLVESEERVLLYGWHHAVYDLWREQLKDLEPAFFTGNESPLQRQAAIKRFTSLETPILIMSLRAGAGIDGLQYVEKARNVVFGELDWSPGVHEQCIGRIARDGQPDPVDAYFMVAEDGSDPIIAEALGLKGMQIRGLRDPNAPETVATQGENDRARTLAEKFLRQRGLAVPDREVPPAPLAGEPLAFAL